MNSFFVSIRKGKPIRMKKIYMYYISKYFFFRLGLVQFKKDMADTTFSFDRWHIYKALFEVFEAMHVSTKVIALLFRWI